MNNKLQAPFPWFGGKSRVADVVWDRFGKVDNYVEPFFGSGAVLLGSPYIPKSETINDKDGFVSNFWRAIKYDPEKTARYADWPVNETDLHARHSYLVNIREDFTARLEGDPNYFDAKIAGWWVWGLCAWIGGGWCSGNGPWQSINGKLVHLSDRGQGILEWFIELQDRLREVRVCSGDWSRVCGSAPTIILGLTAVFLDPPYKDERDPDIYAEDSLSVADDAAKWAFENGDNTLLRIALCGYVGEHNVPNGWIKYRWKASGGYASRNSDNRNAYKETIWFSPHCLKGKQGDLFENGEQLAKSQFVEVDG